MNTKYQIAVLGDRDSVLGFRALGLRVHFADTPAQAAPVLHDLAREGAAVIYITEQLAAGMGDDIARYQDSPIPAIILIPGRQGTLGLGMEGLRSAVQRAVGADIVES